VASACESERDALLRPLQDEWGVVTFAASAEAGVSVSSKFDMC
jgi:hypothetical protein